MNVAYILDRDRHLLTQELMSDESTNTVGFALLTRLCSGVPAFGFVFVKGHGHGGCSRGSNGKLKTLPWGLPKGVELKFKRLKLDRTSITQGLSWIIQYSRIELDYATLKDRARLSNTQGLSWIIQHSRIELDYPTLKD